MINHDINRLLNFGLQQGLIHEEDKTYASNMLLGLLKVDEFELEEINETLATSTPILENILDYAVFIKDGVITLRNDVSKIKESSGKTLNEIFKEVYHYASIS